MRFFDHKASKVNSIFHKKMVQIIVKIQNFTPFLTEKKSTKIKFEAGSGAGQFMKKQEKFQNAKNRKFLAGKKEANFCGWLAKMERLKK